MDRAENRQLFGQKMARLRKQQGYSIRELAELSGFATNTILSIEKGKFSPRFEIVEKILSVLGAHLEIIMDETEEEDDDIDDYLEDLSK